MGMVLQFVDGLRNALTGAGTARDPRSHAGYGIPLIHTQQTIDFAYRGSGLLRKIIQIPPLDMVREWRDWKLETDQITKVEELEKKLDIRGKVRKVEVLRGLGGGALILGLPGDPASPAPKAGRDALSYVHVVSRWHLTYRELQDDARLPDYGEPIMWQMSSGGGQIDIHPSRVIPFRADTTATLASSVMSGQDQFWGESKVAQVLDAVTDSDTARAAFASLLHKARLTRIGIPGMMDLVSTAGGETALQKRVSIMAAAESLYNVTYFDSGDAEGKGGEKVEDAEYDFAGAKDMMYAYAEFCAAISDIPATRLLGRAPEGLNSSGGSQQADWNKLVMAMQTLDLAPCLDRLDQFLVPSAIGTTPDGAWYEWAPLDQPTQKEKAERWKTQTEAIKNMIDTGTIPDEAMAKGVQSLMIDEGYLPELEQALAEIPEDERYGITPTEEEVDPSNPEAAKGGDPNGAGGGGGLEDVPARRAANDTWFATDAVPKPLYVQRKLLNAADLIAWAKAQGFETTLPAADMHVTVLYSRQAVDPMKMGETWTSEADGGLTIKPGGPRAVEKLGEDAVVLLFASWSLQSRHREMVEAGASHDWPEYQPHVTLSYTLPAGVDLDAIKPYTGELRFGPELFEPLDLDWKCKIGEE